MNSPVWDAIYSILGWTLVIPATAAGGLWLGLALGQGELFPPIDALGILVACLIAWVFFPQLLIAWGVSLVALVVLLRTESGKLKAFAAAVNALPWFSIAFWASR